MSINLSAYQEMERNRKHIKAFERQGCKVLEMNTKQLTYRGTAWEQLGAFGKRKLENLFVLEDMKKPVKVIYI